MEKNQTYLNKFQKQLEPILCTVPKFIENKEFKSIGGGENIDVNIDYGEYDSYDDIDYGEYDNYDDLDSPLVVVDHTEEDVTKLGEEALLRILRSGNNFSYELTKELNFNPKFPEFQNVYIKDLKNDKACTYYKGEWKENKINVVVGQMYIMSKINLKKLLNTKVYQNKLNEREKELLMKIRKSPQSQDKIMSKKLRIKIEPIMCNIPKILE
jgi:hypothetical protein